MNANESQRADKVEIERLRLALARSSEQPQRYARIAAHLAKWVCEMKDAITGLAHKWRPRGGNCIHSEELARDLDALTSAWARRRAADGGT